jgi:hypothetical protein
MSSQLRSSITSAIAPPVLADLRPPFSRKADALRYLCCLDVVLVPLWLVLLPMLAGMLGKNCCR